MVRDKPRRCYDVECYINLFTNYVIDYNTGEEMVFEISERKNQVNELYEFIKTPQVLIGFNSIHYDNLLLNYIYINYDYLKTLPAIEITGRLKNLSDTIIADKEGDDYKRYSKYKYNQPFESIDLFLYWSKMLRKSKMLSLKSLAVNINWHKIQELPIKPSATILPQQIDLILSYNRNDVLITKQLVSIMKDQINLRMVAKKRYGLDCLNWDGVKLGLNILIKRYCERTGIPEDVVRQMRTPRDQIALKDIILPEINFEPGDESYTNFIEEGNLVYRFKSFSGLLKYLKSKTVFSTNELNCQVLFKGNRYDIKSGGLHTFHNPGVVTPGPDDIYEDDDVSSYYPSLGAEWGFIPEHLGKEFAEELGAVKKERLELKAKGLGKSPEAELLKLAMNGGFYGNTNNQYTPMYDPKCMLSVTINGQLFLLMLCERLMKIGVRIDMCNTDGITIIYNKKLKEQVKEIFKTWEKESRMELESVVYDKVVRMNINNYKAIFKNKKGEIETKNKGLFLVKPPIDQSSNMLVVSKAIEAYYTKGTPIEEFILKHDNIYDFCICQKVDKSYKVVWNGEEQQNLNRYYVCNKGPYLYKMRDNKLSHLLKGWAVQLFNDYEEKPMKDYDINYKFYIAETRKLINTLEPQQLTMF